MEVTVGVLYDYFRIRDDKAAVALMEETDGGPVVQHGDEPVVDAVDAKGIDPGVLLGQLVALAAQVEWTPKLVNDELVWPAGARDDMEYQGPWLTRLGDPARDTLAGVADESMGDLAAAWAQAEEFYSGTEAEELQPVVADLVGLARRAREAGDHLYCWMCL